jgi:hypothetical protein
MTITQLLEKLELKKQAIDFAIKEILEVGKQHTTRTKAKEIIKAVRKKPHWTQMLSKSQMKKHVMKMAAAKRAKKNGSSN